ncbi:MAG: cytochrome c oxidase assembly protein [Pseudomonadota bacterium]
MDQRQPTPPPPQNLGRKALPFVGVAFGMLGMAYAAVPLYDLFCRVTGFGGTTQVADSSRVEPIDRTITVRFDASLARDMPWRFEPVDNSRTIRVGETGLAFYTAHNPTDRPIKGTASYNVAPFSMGAYFVKVECFCFQEQVLEPGQTIRMPVTFYVDPGMVEDGETEAVHTVTLSYTFYATDDQPDPSGPEGEPERRADLSGSPAGARAAITTD